MSSRNNASPTPVITLRPDWPAPRGVHACTTTRDGGYSRAPYHGLNLADHVGDDAAAVAANRRLVMEALGLPGEPMWLRQVHGSRVIDAAAAGANPTADAAYTTRAGTVCAVLTADCLPILLCRRRGTAVAAVHVGWRGLAAGVIAASVQATAADGAELLAWLGPAIGPQAYQVDDDVRDALNAAVNDAGDAFARTSTGKWRVDLYHLARRALADAGVTRVYGGGWCAFSDERRFYSHRRDGVTGRMATMVWMQDE